MKEVKLMFQANMPFPAVSNGILKEQLRLGFTGEIALMDHCMICFEPNHVFHAQPPRVDEMTYGDAINLWQKWSEKKWIWRRWKTKPLIVYEYTGYLPDSVHDDMKRWCTKQLGKPYRMFEEYFNWPTDHPTWKEFGEDTGWHCSYYVGAALRFIVDFPTIFPDLERPGRITPAHAIWLVQNVLNSTFPEVTRRAYAIP